MSDAEWVVVKVLLPVRGWLAGLGGRPEGYCHRITNRLAWQWPGRPWTPWNRP